MRRSPLLLITVLFVAVLVVVGVILVISGGKDAGPATTAGNTATTTAAAAPTAQNDEQNLVTSLGGGAVPAGPAQTTATPAAATPATPAPPVQQVVGPENAPTTEWANRIRGLGYDVVFNAGSPDVISHAEIAGGEGDTAWRWTGDNIRLDGLGTNRIIIRLQGPQTLTYSVGGVVQTYNFTGSTFRLTVDRAASGAVDTATLDISNLALTTPAGGDPITADRAQIVLTRAAGDGAVPAGSTAALSATNIAFPGSANGALGSTLASLGATLTFTNALAGLAEGDDLAAWRAAPLTASDVNLDWGLLKLASAGTLGLDAQNLPTGALAVTLTDFIPALDAFNVARHLDTGVLADWYAVLISDAAAGTVPALTLTIGNGKIELTDDADGLAPLQIGTVGPPEVGP